MLTKTLFSKSNLSSRRIHLHILPLLPYYSLNEEIRGKERETAMLQRDVLGINVLAGDARPGGRASAARAGGYHPPGQAEVPSPPCFLTGGIWSNVCNVNNGC